MSSKELTPTRVWQAQFRELLVLRLISARRNLGVTLAQVLIGAVACCMLSIFQSLANSVLSTSTDHYPSVKVGGIPKCSAIDGTLRPTLDGLGAQEGCYTLLFAPNTPEVSDLVTKAVSRSPGLIMGVDVAPVPGLRLDCSPTVWVNNSLFVAGGDSSTCANSMGQCDPQNPASLLSGYCVPCHLACDNRTMAELTTDFPSGVQTLVWGIGAYFPGGDLSYSISYNISLTQFPFNQPAHAAEVKRAMDEALLGGEGGLSPTLDYRLKDFPRPPPRISGFDVFSQSGGQWTFLVSALLFFQLITSIAVEKEEKLRVGMRQMGLRTSAYWASWAVFSTVLAMCSTLVLLAAGYASGFSFFTNSTPLATFPLYFLTSLSYACFALFLSSLVTTGKSAQQLGYSIALISFMFIAVVGSGSGLLLNLLYSAQLKPWMVTMRQILLVISPALAYTTVLYDISNLASNTLDLAAQRIVPGPGFHASDLIHAKSIDVLGYTCNVPSPMYHLGIIALDGLLYILGGLYLDAVLPGPQGSPSHPLFFLGCKYRTKRVDGGRREGDAAIEDPGVSNERVAAASLTSIDPNTASSSSSSSSTIPLVVRISDLFVVYRSGWTALFFALTGMEWAALVALVMPGVGGASGMDGGSNNSSGELGAGDVYAVSGLSLTCANGEIVALLGHNGAGKSTSINVLTGLISAAGGVAEVAGVDVVAGARPPGARAMGVCPQHDLLFPLLTAREMLHLFCALKGIPREDWGAEVSEVLTAVNLSDVADRGTGTYSGGMKRRLSVALAALGHPPLLLFDEPSTGLDPLARQDLLQLIQSLKRTSGILLTTHSMSEASALGDRVAIMAQGKLVALGTTVELTQRYGKGYLVSLTLTSSKVECFNSVQGGVRGASPDATLTLRDGAAVTFTVPFSHVDTQLPRLLEWCDAEVSKAGGVGAITEFGVSGPSLEEAFLTVTAASHFGLAEQALSAVGGADEGGVMPPPTSSSSSSSSSSSEGDYRPVPEGGDEDSAGGGGGGDKSSPPPPRQYLAVLTKNLTLLSRQRGLCLCQLFTPIIILGLLLLLQSIVNSEVGEYSVTIIPPIYLPLNLYPNSILPPTPPIEGGIRGWKGWSKERLWAPISFLGNPATYMSTPPLPSPSPPSFPSSFTSSPGFGSREHFVSLLSVFAHPPSERKAALEAMTRDPSILYPHIPLYTTASSPPFSPPHRALQQQQHYPGGSTCVRFYLSAVQPLPNGTQLDALLINLGRLPRVESAHPWHNSSHFNATGFLSHIPYPTWCELHNGSFITTPFFAPREDSHLATLDTLDGGDRVGMAMDDELMRDLLILNHADSSVLQSSAPCWDPTHPPSNPDAYIQENCPALILPDGAWTIHDLQAPSGGGGGGGGGGVLSVTIQPNTASSTRYHRPNGVSRPVPPAPGILILDAARLGAMDLLSRAYNGWIGGVGGREGGAVTLPLLTFASTMAERNVQTTSDIVEILGAVLFVILLSAPLPLFIFVHVTEKELRLNEMQLIMGIRGGAMQLVNFGVNAALYACIVGLFWGVSGGYMVLRTMAHTSSLLLLLTFVGHGLALTATASLVGAFLWDRQVATVTGVVLGIITPLIATAVMAGVYGQNLPWALGVSPPPLIYAIPVLGVQFALARILYLATFTSLAFRVSLTSSALNPFTSEVGVAVWSFYLSAAFYTALSWYLERVLPRRYGVAQPPLFCLPRSFVKASVGVCGRRYLWLCGGSLDTEDEGGAGGGKSDGDAPSGGEFSLNDPEATTTNSSSSHATSLFAYTSTWAREAGLSKVAAERAYAKGEDIDVWEARAEVEKVWEEGIEEKKSGGGSKHASSSVSTRYPVIIRHLRKTFDLEASARLAGEEHVATKPTASRLGASGGEGGIAEALLPPSLPMPDSATLSGSSGIPFTLGSAEDMVVGGGAYIEVEQEVMQVSKGKKVAVSDESIALKPGVFGLLGANGAGKTTTLAMLQGLYPPSGGGALVGGYNIETEQMAVRLCLGVCPQHDVLWPMLTVREHLVFYARAKGVRGGKEEEREVASMLAHIGLTDFSNRAASALSGGMRRRLSIGISMIGARTKVVLLDELTTGLDPASRRAVWRIVDESRRKCPDALYLLVSHDMAEVEALCSGAGGRCGIMTYGRLRCVGSLQHLREQYGGGCLLRLVFCKVREVKEEEVRGGGVGEQLTLGAIPEEGEPTPTWVSIKGTITATFPPGKGGARLDGAVFQTRSKGALDRSHPPPSPGHQWVTEKGSAVFILKVGSAHASGAELSMSQAFIRMQALAKDKTVGISGWAIEAQTLDAVFGRIVRHFKK